MSAHVVVNAYRMCVLDVCVCCPRYLRPVVANGICYMSNVCVRTYVCVCCPVISAQ